MFKLVLKFSYIIAVTAICTATLTPSQAQAESVIWSKVVRESLYNFYGGRWTLDWPSIQIAYNVRAINASTGAVLRCGSTVKGGTPVEFQFVPHRYTDITWFGTGTVFDSPYGNWNNNASKSSGTVCKSRNAYLSRNTNGNGRLGGGMFADFSVNPPSKSITGLPASCRRVSGGNMRCQTSKTTTLNARFKFGSTYGKFWSAAKIGGSCFTSREALISLRTGSRKINVASKALNCPIHVHAPTGKPPAAPTIEASSCAIGSISSYIVAATDPDTKSDENKVRFLFDWNGDGTTDQIMPASGYYNSGTPQTIPHVWNSSGTKRIRLAAEDNQGLVSPWVTFTDDITDCLYPPANFDENSIDGAIRLTPDDVINADGTISVSIDDLLENYDENGYYKPGEIEFTMDPRITNTTCTATWDAKRVSSCELYRNEIRQDDIDFTGSQPVEPGLYDIQCVQIRDGATISNKQSCTRAPSFREI